MTNIFKISKYLLGCIFIISGLTKFFSLDSFSFEVAQYADLLNFYWVIRNKETVSILICFLELLMGILAFCKRANIWTTCYFILSMTFFMFITGMNYLFPPIIGSIESCGCFGEFIHFSAKSAFYKSIALWCISIVNLTSLYIILTRKEIHSINNNVS